MMSDPLTHAGCDEEALAGLLCCVPQAPPAWVDAAAELPRARQALAEIERRVLDGAEQRAALTADLEAAIARAGHDPSPAFVAVVRRLVDAHTSG